MVDIGTLSLLLLLGMFVLLAIGMPLGFASAFLALATLVMKFGPDLLFSDFGRGPLAVLGQAVYRQMTNYVLISVPLFIFMAALLERSGIARDMYSSLNVWLSRTRGGIAIVTSVMAVIMAAMSGIIGGEVVLLGLIALPQMLRLGYNQNLAIGTICASGSLGTMIPPSIVLIFYGLVTETSIKALFTASFLPGFMLASFFIIYIIIRSRLQPDQAPLPPDDPDDPHGSEKGMFFLAFLACLVLIASAVLTLRALFFTVTGANTIREGVDPIPLGMVADLPWLIGAAALSAGLILLVFGRERTMTGWQMGKGLVAPIIVIGVVLGSIYGGITGITEAAGMGVIAVFLIGLARREMTFAIVWDSLMRTLKSTGTIIWVTIGAAALAAAYTLSGGPTYVANLIVGTELPSMGVILIMMLIFLIMGMFMDWVGIVLLIMPVFLPIVLRLPVEELGVLGQLEPNHVAIWFGVVFCMNMQVSFLSPPFGPAAFYLKSVAPPHISLTDIFKGFLPFIAIQILALSVLLIWPPIVAILL
ncbi:TRAP transporter large permease subunit [Psychromarinibacter sp. C21-152]|uniref:TRAP transporter large permease subunit n=1 Tax=Psychromarinibacter sediminicola TaxID=3033385 RepID=A0AAE3T987_9RHOB|nr:TRAP transporter large permease subunit [Psychromarinibacter sediminicola]MDF0601598.1 TRAP transporter large permease subunit [Psychromarinibacter sediminicola]